MKSWSWGALGAVKKETCPGRKRWMGMGGLSVATLWVFFFECCFTLKAQVVVNASKGLYDGYIQYTVKQGDL